MSQNKLTREKIERRLTDNLRKNNMNGDQTKAAEMLQPYARKDNLLADAPQNMTFIQRLRYRLVVNGLHKINLTSYRRLRRAYAAIDEIQTDLTKLLRDRDEIAQTLRMVASDRDRLANLLQKDSGPREPGRNMPSTDDLEQPWLSDSLLALSVERERLLGQIALYEYKATEQQSQLEVLRTAHEHLQQDHETLRAAYDQLLNKNTGLEAVINVKNHQKDTEAEETVSLPLTVKVDSVVPHVEDVNAYLADWGKLDAANEFDALYYILETSMRGSEAEIKHRQQEYLPYLTIVDPLLPVVDLGCGRGEFLELMREQGIRALGVDTNAKNIEQLIGKGLEVHHQDALTYLENTAADSLAAVTAFQVIEHVSNAYLRQIIRLAYDKLAPGGFILLETVNPYCLETFRTYYLDPTHQNPVPLDLLSILYQFYGFTEKQLFFQNPITPTVPVSRSQELQYLYQGYGLLGIKPRNHQD
jgi:2-polyprenyl-3-methyl-5-hydroxy-6-metoxy-1,4-benzoquinol methylase